MKFQVLQEIANASVWLWSQDGRALALVPREVLKDAAGLGGDVELDNAKLILLATANVEALGRIASVKHDRGPRMPAELGAYPRVMILADDIGAAGEVLSASVVETAEFWSDGTQVPAFRRG